MCWNVYAVDVNIMLPELNSFDPRISGTFECLSRDEIPRNVENKHQHLRAFERTRDSRNIIWKLADILRDVIYAIHL